MAAIRILFVLLILGLSVQAFAQSKTDSLRKVLNKTDDPAGRIKLLFSINELFFTGARYDSLQSYAEELILLARKENDERMHLAGISFQAQSFLRKDSADFFARAQDALKQCESKNYKFGIAVNCLGMGSRLLTLGRYEGAMEFLQRGSRVITDNDPANELALKSDLIRTISAVYHHQGNYTEALEEGLESSRLAERVKDNLQILKSYLNLGGLYGELSSPENGLGSAGDRSRYHVLAKKYMTLSYTFSVAYASVLTQAATACNLGMLYTEDKRYDSANYYLDIAIALGQRTNFHEMLSNAYRAKTTVWAQRPDSVSFYFDRAIESAQKSKNPYLEIDATLQLSRMRMEQKRFRESEALALHALDQARQIKRLNDVRAAYLLLHDIHFAQRQYDKALSYYKEYENAKDSMVNEKNYATIEELKTKYETELKDKEIQGLEQTTRVQGLELQRKNFLLAGLVVFVLLTVGVVFLFFRQRTLSHKQKQLEVENRFLRFQLNPHFLFNSLVSIQRYLLENNPDAAADYLAKFSRLMRQQLEYARHETITIEQEVEMLRNYLDLQKIHFKDKFTYDILVNPALDIENTKIAPMFIQPFVENALEHGIRDLDRPGKIVINLEEADAGLHVTITDNGNGITSKVSSSGEHLSLATQIIRERLALLGKSDAGESDLTVESSPENGTSVRLRLPISS